ncbi:DMT family transporter [Homoserinibacter sp. GY 40078]|nr:DMT family transporter [Homoserinibacter sp. GY 40078]
MALQPRVNGELAVHLDDGIVAAFISFAVGTIACGLALVVWAPGRRGLGRIREALALRTLPVPYLFGGVAGAVLVTAQGLTAAVLGVALFTVALVGGQTIGSLVVDRRGVGTMGPKPFTVQRLLGAALAVVAVGWAVSDRIATEVAWWMLVLPLLAGAGAAWQQAVNGQLRERAGSVLSATFVSFVAGTAALIVAAGVEVAVAGPPDPLPGEAWLYTGGLLGIVFVAAAAALVPLIGVLMFGLATIAGQLSIAVLLDLIAPVGVATLDTATVGGAVLAIVAVAVAAIRRPPRQDVTDATGASSR